MKYEYPRRLSCPLIVFSFMFRRYAPAKFKVGIWNMSPPRSTQHNANTDANTNDEKEAPVKSFEEFVCKSIPGQEGYKIILSISPQKTLCATTNQGRAGRRECARPLRGSSSSSSTSTRITDYRGRVTCPAPCWVLETTKDIKHQG